MPKDATTTRGGSLPDEIIVWEILVRLPPKSLLRCRSVCRSWRRVTNTHGFLLAHHGRQPSLPLFSCNNGFRYCSMLYCHSILAFDYTATVDDDRLHVVAKLDDEFYVEASCDGLLVLSKPNTIRSGPCLTICNPATREHTPLGLPTDLEILGMYSHNPTGEYRLLLQQQTHKIAGPGHERQIGCYVFALGSNQLPRYIGRQEIALGSFTLPVRMGDSLHWYPLYYPNGETPSEDEGKVVLVFDTIAESFRYMRAPIAPIDSYIFEMEDTLGIHSRGYSIVNIDIWVLRNYESEAWDLRYRVKLPVAEIMRDFGNSGDHWDLNVVSVDGGMILLVKVDGWVFQVDNNGKLQNNSSRHRLCLCVSGSRLKQSLVQHSFFPALQGYVINASPFFCHVE
ncbi:hypothetical protein QYE76_058876 [Lolium multiflorum]|uniref:F-box domain-containing protein n=1 Tax=Lolium multiflorum TaxID=4521 RepID=A0AAD8WQB2_LOLMU|nr:hypothetical protein QYE76_058876 [Lolium multiflorum]